MTKNEFLSRLEAELEARRVPEPEDILGEYRRHFEYKMADGYSEEEIAARLGPPEELAAQFEPETPAKRAKRAGTARAAVTWTGFVFLDIFVLSFFLVFACWVLVVACAAVAAGLTALCLLIPFDMQPYVNLPEMPYWCGAIYALALAALAVLSAEGCGYFPDCWSSSAVPIFASTATQPPQLPDVRCSLPCPAHLSLLPRAAGVCARCCLFH